MKLPVRLTVSQAKALGLYDRFVEKYKTESAFTLEAPEGSELHRKLIEELRKRRVPLRTDQWGFLVGFITKDSLT